MLALGLIYFHYLFRILLFNFQILGDFPDLFLLVISTLILFSKEYALKFQFFKTYWRLFYGQEYDLGEKAENCT